MQESLDKILTLCWLLLEAARREDWQGFEVLLEERAALNADLVSLSGKAMQSVLDLDREIVTELERRQSTVGAAISEVQRARRAIGFFKRAGGGRSPAKRNVALFV